MGILFINPFIFQQNVNNNDIIYRYLGKRTKLLGMQLLYIIY